MSEAIQSPPELQGAKAPKLMRIPTELGDITKDWAKLVVNQYLMKEDRDLLKKGVEDIAEFEVQNCKESNGDFSCTYRMDVTILTDDANVRKLITLIYNDRIQN